MEGIKTGMNEPRRQHHVPIVYLKMFSTGNKDNQINVYDKVANKFYCTSLEKVALERDFYTITGAKEEYAYAIEKFYAEYIEPSIKKILEYIKKVSDPSYLNVNTIILGDEVKIGLSYIMAIQLLRGISARQLNQNTFDNNIEKVLDEALKKFGYSQDKKQEYINNKGKLEYIFKAASAKATLDKNRIEKYTLLFSNRYWYCHKIIDSQKEFITSDNPVMFFNLRTYDATPFSNGILDPDTAIFFPVSPQLMITSVHNKHRGDSFINNVEDGTLIYLRREAKDFIDLLNHKHKEQAVRQVFAHNKNILKEC